MTNQAADLIAHSVLHDTIAHAKHSDALAEELFCLCDDDVDHGHVEEFWGTTDDGYEWRVHLDRQEA